MRPASAYRPGAGISNRRLVWLDVLRGLAMVWILAYHLRADTVGIQPMGRGLVAAAGSSLGGLGRLMVDAGYQGVAVFVLASGYGLALAAGSRGLTTSSFFRRRLSRLLLPYYLAVGLTVAWVAMLGTWSPPMLDRAPYHLGAGGVIAAGTLVGRLGSAALSQSPPPSAWFVVLLIELYALFPALWWLRRRIGAAAFLLCCLGLTVVSRWSVHVLLSVVHDGAQEPYWQSILAPTRLFEFALGIVAASLLPRFRRWWLAAALAPAVAAWAAGSALESGPGDAVSAPLLLAGLGVLGPVLAAGLARLPALGRGLAWVGRRSLEVFLMQDLVRLALGAWRQAGHPARWSVPTAAAFTVATMAAAASFGRLVDVIAALRRGVPTGGGEALGLAEAET